MPWRPGIVNVDQVNIKWVIARLLTSEEAARRLGVKVTTLYAYVSRGLLSSHRAAGGRQSLFALADIERLADRSRGARHAESRLATVTTRVTQLGPGGPSYRGREAPGLVGHVTFEDAAALLWESGEAGDWRAPDLGECPLTDMADRMRWTLVMCGATDPRRADLRPGAVTGAARRVIAALVDTVGRHDHDGDGGLPIAARLNARLGGTEDGRVGAVDAALVLMADHELATSTVAVRLAASTRADLCDALLAGLATLAGPLHGGASRQAHELLVRAERDGAAPALSELLRAHRHLPGFGHMIYRDEDPRFAPLMALVEPLLSDSRRALVHEVLSLAATHDVAIPNCDLALATLSWGTGMPADAGRTLFTVARVAGWTAHYQEELLERPLRFRARAVYSV